MFRNELKVVGETASELRVANYMILFGGRDLVGEFFVKETEVESPYTRSGIIHVDFEHGQDPDGVGMDKHEILGFVDWRTSKTDDAGIFVERVLNRQAKYMNKIEELIRRGLIGSSSAAIKGAPERDGDKIIKWPLERDSLTLTPCEPRMLGSNIIREIKSLSTAYPYSKSLAEAVQLIDTKMLSVDDVKDLKDSERLLRDAAGFSRADATALVSRIKSLARSECEAELTISKTFASQLSTISTNLFKGD